MLNVERYTLNVDIIYTFYTLRTGRAGGGLTSQPSVFLRHADCIVGGWR